MLMFSVAQYRWYHRGPDLGAYTRLVSRKPLNVVVVAQLAVREITVEGWTNNTSRLLRRGPGASLGRWMGGPKQAERAEAQKGLRE